MIACYKQEILDGLESVISDNRSINYNMFMELVDSIEDQKKIIKASQSDKDSADTVDLHYFKSILVSTNWNKNDDVWDKYEVWAAKDTPEDKPINLEHDCDKIVGHLLGSIPVDGDGNVISENSCVDDLPDFDIITPSVVYKTWSKEDTQEKMDKIIQKIINKEICVSVEALFSNFDYALLDDKGIMRVVCRNKETAFLTKHLRAYGGSGVYDKYKVGRLLRNIIFCGKGLVENPANPKSLILGKKFDFQLSKNSDLVYLNNSNGDKMNEKEINDIKEALAKVTQERDAALVSVQEKETVVAELTTSRNKFKEDLDAAQVLIKQHEENINKQGDTIKSLVKSNRVSLVMSKLNLNETDAKEYVEALEVLNDEKFTNHVNKEAERLAKATTVSEPVTETVPDLKTVTSSNEPALSVPTVNPEDQKKALRDKVCSFVSKGKKKE